MFELEAVERRRLMLNRTFAYDPPEAPQPIKEAVAKAHADAVALASSLKQFAAKHIDPIEVETPGPEGRLGSKPRSRTKPAPQGRRQGPPGDVYAHLDVACYPPHVLQLPWRKVVDAARLEEEVSGSRRPPGALLLDLQQAGPGVRAAAEDAGGLGRAGRDVAERGGEKKSPVRAPPVRSAGSTTGARGLRGRRPRLMR